MGCDQGLQLYYNRARYYNPQLGRFISRDPIDIADDVNLYSYVGNNSVMYTDPNGTEKKWIRENEGNAWYFEEEFTYDDEKGIGSAHASLYFIENGNEHVISFGGQANSFKDIILQGLHKKMDGLEEKDVNLNYISARRDHIKNNINRSNTNVVKINSDYIDAQKLKSWYDENFKETPDYNLYINNCSDQVEKALSSAGFFKYTEFYGIGTPLPGNVSLPGTSPAGLSYDIKVELFYKNLFN